jgi:hypothetical protein
MINHLGNQLERQFFIEHRHHSPLFLDFENIGTLCFNLGDSFEYFLEENCLGSCPINCPRDLDGHIEIIEGKIEDKIQRKLELLQSFLVGKLDKEQCLRIDLMNHVILDTLMHFYSEEFDLEFKENDLALLELAEFIENVIVDFIRFEGQSLLQKPFETAISYFEELLENEVEENTQPEWKKDTQDWQKDKDIREWEKLDDSVEKAFMNFLSDEYYNPHPTNNALAHDIDRFSSYLRNYAKIQQISEISENHLGEFLSVWLVREFILSDSKQISYIFRATARFITFLYHQYNINLKKEFLKSYEKLKLDLPRVIQATNIFISEYNLLEAVLNSQEQDVEKKIGFYKVEILTDRMNKLLEIKNIYDNSHTLEIKFNSSAYLKLRKGDILHATLINRIKSWEVLEIQYIYPNLALKFI